MTSKELLLYVEIELNKYEALPLLIEDFNYIANKAVQQLCNLEYNQYDLNQQTSDNLRVLKSNCVLNGEDAIKSGRWYGESYTPGNSIGASYRFKLPDDYFHIQHCIVQFKAKQDFRRGCYRQGQLMEFEARRMTSDMEAGILNNIYSQPKYRRPFYFISSNTYGNVDYIEVSKYLDFDISDFYTEQPVKPSETTPGTPGVLVSSLRESQDRLLQGETLLSIYNGADFTAKAEIEGNYTKRLTALATTGSYAPSGQTAEGKIKNILNIVKESSNPYESKAKLGALYASNFIEIRYGKDNSVWEIHKIYVDYLRIPQRITLTQKEVDTDVDISQVLEFPEYMCYELVNTIVKLALATFADPRINIIPQVNQTIAPPQQVIAARQQQQKR